MAQQKQQIKLSERFGIRKTEKQGGKDQFIAEGEKFIINGKQAVMHSEYVGLARSIIFF